MTNDRIRVRLPTRRRDLGVVYGLGGVFGSRPTPIEDSAGCVRDDCFYRHAGTPAAIGKATSRDRGSGAARTVAAVTSRTEEVRCLHGLCLLRCDRIDQGARDPPLDGSRPRRVTARSRRPVATTGRSDHARVPAAFWREHRGTQLVEGQPRFAGSGSLRRVQ